MPQTYSRKATPVEDIVLFDSKMPFIASLPSFIASKKQQKNCKNRPWQLNKSTYPSVVQSIKRLYLPCTFTSPPCGKNLTLELPRPSNTKSASCTSTLQDLTWWRLLQDWVHTKDTKGCQEIPEFLHVNDL